MTAPLLSVARSGYGGRGYRAIFEEGQPVVPSVTTSLGALDRGGLTQWAVDQVAAYYAVNPEAILNRSVEQAFGWGRFYWSRKPDVDSKDHDPNDIHKGVLQEAADQGTFVHEWIEARLNGWFQEDIQNEAQAQMIEAYLDWEAQHDIEVYATEATVFGNGYAGTADTFWSVDGVKLLNDNKTSRAVRDEHLGQLGALGAAHTMALRVFEPSDASVEYKGNHFEPVALPDFEGYSILHIRPDDVDSQGNFIPAFCELIRVPNPVVDAAFELFRAALAARMAQSGLKEVKKREGWDH